MKHCIRDQPLTKIIAAFLFKMSFYVTQKLFDEFYVLMVFFRKALNEIGWKMLDRVYPGQGYRKEERDFCEVNNGQYAAEICNDFFKGKLAYYLRALSQARQPRFEYIGIKD